VIHNFNRDGFDALYPRYRGGRPQAFTLPKRQEIKRIALSDPQDLGQPFATWSLAKLADYLVAEGVVNGHLPRAAAAATAPRGRPLSSGEDVEALQRPRLSGQA
jgi:transposase